MALSEITRKGATVSKAQEVITKHEGNPILTFKDVPWHCTMAYNPSCVKTPEGKYALTFRADEFTDINEDQIEKLGVVPAKVKNGSIALALSDDGINFEVQPKAVITPLPDEENSLYDPRMTVIEGKYWMTYCTSTERGIMNGIAYSEDLFNWTRIHRTLPDNRNMLLFPEKVGGLYVRFDRPFGHIFLGHDFDLWISFSPDLEFWGRHQLLLRAKDIPWGKAKIGPSTSPIKTDDGWLTMFHAVENRKADRFGWGSTYRGGVMLLDLEDPTKIIGMCPDPVLEPTEEYEEVGWRSKVVFPGAMIPEDDGTVKIYYGVADQSVALATAKMQDLIDLCK